MATKSKPAAGDFANLRDAKLAGKKEFAMRLAIAILGLGMLGVSYAVVNDAAEARSCSHCYKLESKCRRESKGQANCDAIVSRCLRQCRQGG